MSFAIGSLVKVRDREWVVLPESTDEVLEAIDNFFLRIEKFFIKKKGKKK